MEDDISDGDEDDDDDNINESNEIDNKKPVGTIESVTCDSANSRKKNEDTPESFSSDFEHDRNQEESNVIGGIKSE